MEMKINNHSNIHVITPLTFLRMKSNSASFPNYYYCSMIFQVGDEILSKQGQSKRHYYHIECARHVNLL